jgi:hypothetical protein
MAANHDGDNDTARDTPVAPLLPKEKPGYQELRFTELSYVRVVCTLQYCTCMRERDVERKCRKEKRKAQP